MNVFLIILGTLVIGAGVGLGARRIYHEEKTGTTILLIAATAIIGLGLITLGDSFEIIPTGYTGVESKFGQISERTLSQGFNWKTPFISDIKLVNNKIRTIQFTGQVWGECSDKTPVYASDITVSFQINPEKSAWICANIANGVDNPVGADLVQTAIKSAMVELPYNEATVRSKIEPKAMGYLAERLNEKYGEDTITVIQFVIGQMDFDEVYNKAIQDKSIAIQTREKQAIENETKIAKAEADKQVEILNAEAAAEKVRISAEAEAAANELLNGSLTDNILRSKFYDSWDGVLPRVMGQDTVITSIGE